MLNEENRQWSDEELEAYLAQLELIEPPKAMADEIIDRVKTARRTRRQIILFDSRVFKVLLALSACFVLLFTGVFQSFVDKSIEYSGEFTASVEQLSNANRDALQKKIDNQVIKYQQKIEKGLKRYDKE